MQFRLWPRSRRVEPASDEPAAEEPPAPPEAPPRQPATAFARPYAPGDEGAPTLPAPLPAEVSLTLEEAKAAIRAAGGDVIQIGFLANAYRRQRDEDPQSRETRAARERLSELVAKRLRDRKLLAEEGRLELLDEPPARNRRT